MTENKQNIPVNTLITLNKIVVLKSTISNWKSMSFKFTDQEMTFAKSKYFTVVMNCSHIMKNPTLHKVWQENADHSCNIQSLLYTENKVFRTLSQYAYSKSHCLDTITSSQTQVLFWMNWTMLTASTHTALKASEKLSLNKQTNKTKPTEPELPSKILTAFREQCQPHCVKV